MSIPKGCIEAAKTDVDKSILVQPSPQARARRVILALAKEMPPDAGQFAADYIRNNYGVMGVPSHVLDAAIAAFLTHVVGDTP